MYLVPSLAPQPRKKIPRHSNVLEVQRRQPLSLPGGRSEYERSIRVKLLLHTILFTFIKLNQAAVVLVLY